MLPPPPEPTKTPLDLVGTAVADDEPSIVSCTPHPLPPSMGWTPRASQWLVGSIAKSSHCTIRHRPLGFPTPNPHAWLRPAPIAAESRCRQHTAGATWRHEVTVHRAPSHAAHTVPRPISARVADSTSMAGSQSRDASDRWLRQRQQCAEHTAIMWTPHARVRTRPPATGGTPRRRPELQVSRRLPLNRGGCDPRGGCVRHAHTTNMPSASLPHRRLPLRRLSHDALWAWDRSHPGRCSANERAATLLVR